MYWFLSVGSRDWFSLPFPRKSWKLLRENQRSGAEWREGYFFRAIGEAIVMFDEGSIMRFEEFEGFGDAGHGSGG